MKIASMSLQVIFWNFNYNLIEMSRDGSLANSKFLPITAFEMRHMYKDEL